jgi:uncharacterized protein YegL
MNRRSNSRFTFVFVALGAAAAAFWGCTASSNNTFMPGSGGSGGNTGGAATTSSSSGDGGGSFGIDAGMSDGDDQLDDASVCSGQEAQATLVPLDMIVVLDKSGSMSGEKWDTATTALKAFFNDPNSDGIGAGLVYFPNDQSNECVYTDYANLDVPIGTLPGNAPALVTSIDAHDADGSDTPTYPALKGALAAATAYQDTHSDHKVIVVIATDGDPNGCPPSDSASIAGLAKSARNYNGVQTYAIAVPGATLANLNAIAVAGGTGKAYDVTQDITQFSAKMAEIRANALACEFPIPEPPMGEQLDPGKVNVNYTPGGSTTATTLPNVLGASQCSGKQAWYYDNNTAPTKIELCPAACQKVQADSGAKVSVKFGCKTIAM